MQSRWEAERAARQEESEYDDEDDDQEGKAKRIDTERVQKIKELLFDLYRVATGEDKLQIPDFIDALIEQTSLAGNAEKYGDFLFSS